MSFGRIVAETFCIYPWTNIHTNTDGRCKLCCNIYTEDYITIDDEFAILTQFDEILLQILYDRRLSPGISEKEASQLVREIASEIKIKR